MSRIGRMPIQVPTGVTVTIKEDGVTVKGPKGELHQKFHRSMTVTLENNTLTVSRPDDDQFHRSLHGLTRTLLSNMVQGVTKGFVKELEITGVGYRAEKVGSNLKLRMGFSHPIEVTPIPGVTLDVEGTTKIKVSGTAKEVVGEMASRIRAIRLPDVYRGKGIRYAGEVVRKKAGKAGKGVGVKA
ncbi:MAG: 50S ribosomal protein L6 [Dehalococcoidales bacterium]|nr:50S ribosomal protein L6 [Dehalococcoidales bacterium]